MNARRMKPSRVRAMGPRETAFMNGEPVGDFDPAPFYLEPTADDLPFTPDAQHSATYGSVRYEGDPRDAAFSSRERFVEVAPGIYQYAYQRPQQPPSLLDRALLVALAAVSLVAYGVLVVALARSVK